MATTKNNPAPQKTAQPQPSSRFDEETELSSYAPYWTPEVGAYVECIPVDVDLRDPTFPRFILQSTMDEPFEAFRGAKADAESVAIQKGDLFSVSVYASLRGLEEYRGLEVSLRCSGTRDTGQPNEMLVFKIGTTAETRKALNERRFSRAIDANGQPANGKIDFKGLKQLAESRRA